ncbi:MAG: PAS domain-containing protein, partial [Cyanobacteriota bacterium]|nr:PAS domain-containing protein [Cyanobacteriota bacterium]
ILKDSESLQRQYLLTGKKDVLKSFNIKALDAERETQKLLTSIDRNGQDQASGKQLEAFVHRHLQKLRQGVELRQSRGLEAAIDRTPIPLLDEATLLMQQIKAVETVALRQKQQTATNTAIQAMVAFLVGITLNLAIILWTYRLIRRETLQRNQAEVELRQTLEILDLASNSIIIRDMEDRITYWNKGAETFYGWTREEVQGKHIHTLLQSTFPESLDLTLKQFLHQGHWEGELQHQTRQGQSIVVASQWTLQRDSSGQPHAQLEIDRDITDRKQAEEALKRSEEQFRSLVVATSQIIWTTDAEGRVVADTPTWRHFTGQTVAEVMEFGWLEAIHPDDRERIARVWMQAIQTQSFYEAEHRIRAMDGRYRYFVTRATPILNEDGSIREWIGTCTDIHDRKLAEAQMKEISERLSLALQSGGIGCWEWDIVQNTLIWDERMYELYGVTKESETRLAYEIWSTGLHPDDREASETLIRQATLGEAEFDTEFRVVHPDGSIHFIKAFGLVRRDAEGNPQKMIGANFDISDRKRAEIALAEAKEAAEVANRTKSEFLANMNHELRTPLNGILGYAQILQRDPETQPKQQKGLGVIHQCGSHLLTLINDILDLSKLEVQKMTLYPQDFHLANFLSTTVEICRIKAEQKGIAFHYQPADNLPTATYADDKRLRQVLLNLLSNAVKFTDFGSVTFSVEVVRHFSSVLDSTSNKKPKTKNQKRTLDDQEQMTNDQLPITNYQLPITRIRFQVEDTGIGIPPEKLQTIFLPFEQAGKRDRNSEGTGLGLAISQQIVQMMGSTIKVSSTPGQGSIFRFEVDLPAAADWLSQTTTAQQKIVGYQGKRYTILVVDDRPENRAVVIGMLKPLGFKTIEADDGQTGLDRAIQNRPDLIVTDVRMSQMDGLEMTRRLRQLPDFARLPIIASPASLSRVEMQDTFDAGCSSFLPKPIEFSGLLGELQRHLELQWIYETASEAADSSAGASEPAELVVPPSEELAFLYQAARDGFMTDIQQEANRLKQLNPEYGPFANQLLKLSQQFDDEAILNLLASHCE